MFRSQGPSALTSYRNDGTVSSNILLVNEHVWAFGRFSQLSISIAFIWHFTAAKWCSFSHLCQNWKRVQRGINQNHIINMRVVITLFWARKLASTFLLPRVWSCAYPWLQEDRSVRNKLNWDRGLGSWLRQSPLSVHLPKAGGQEMRDFEPIIPPLLAPRRWDVSGNFPNDGERFRRVLRLRLKTTWIQ